MLLEDINVRCQLQYLINPNNFLLYVCNFTEKEIHALLTRKLFKATEWPVSRNFCEVDDKMLNIVDVLAVKLPWQREAGILMINGWTVQDRWKLITIILWWRRLGWCWSYSSCHQGESQLSLHGISEKTLNLFLHLHWERGILLVICNVNHRMTKTTTNMVVLTGNNLTELVQNGFISN